MTDTYSRPDLGPPGSVTGVSLLGTSSGKADYIPKTVTYVEERRFLNTYMKEVGEEPEERTERTGQTREARDGDICWQECQEATNTYARKYEFTLVAYEDWTINTTLKAYYDGVNSWTTGTVGAAGSIGGAAATGVASTQAGSAAIAEWLLGDAASAAGVEILGGEVAAAAGTASTVFTVAGLGLATFYIVTNIMDSAHPAGTKDTEGWQILGQRFLGERLWRRGVPRWVQCGEKHPCADARKKEPTGGVGPSTVPPVPAPGITPPSGSPGESGEGGGAGQEPEPGPGTSGPDSSPTPDIPGSNVPLPQTPDIRPPSTPRSETEPEEGDVGSSPGGPQVFMKDLFGKPLPAAPPDLIGDVAPGAIYGSGERLRTHLVETYQNLQGRTWYPCRSCALDDMEDDWWDSYTAERLLIEPNERIEPTVNQRWLMHEIAFDVRATNENLEVVPAVRRHGWSCGTKTVFGLGAGAVVLGATFGGLAAGGAFSGSNMSTVRTHNAVIVPPQSLAGSLPTLFNRQLQFSSTGSRGPSTYTVILQPTSTAGQFVETQVDPTTNSQQVTTETFSASGVNVWAVQTTFPTGTSDEHFSTPLLLLKAPYSAGTSWSSTATSTSSQGVQNTVQTMDRITGIEQLSVAGRTLQVVVVDLHHVVSQTTQQGLVTQASTGTLYFSPLLGVDVSGHSQEVISEPGQAPRTAANQFQLESIG